MSVKEYKMTRETYDNLKSEMEYLKTVREKEVADLIKEARSFGDLSENSEYDEAKNEQGKLYSRMAELEAILAGAVIIDAKELSSDVVSHGSRVTVSVIGDDDVEEYQIVGSQEVDPMSGKISDESPLGKALIGNRENDTVTVDAPVGKIQYKILKITK